VGIVVSIAKRLYRTEFEAKTLLCGMGWCNIVGYGEYLKPNLMFLSVVNQSTCSWIFNWMYFMLF
jgi:hypothetical protein